MLNNPYEEIERRKKEKNILNEIKNEKWLFTKSRILLLVSIFIVFLLPLIYRYFSSFLK